MERQGDHVLRSVEERGVRLVRLWFTDVLVAQHRTHQLLELALRAGFDDAEHARGVSR